MAERVPNRREPSLGSTWSSDGTSDHLSHSHQKPVAIRTRFDGRWSTGFEVVQTRVDPNGEHWHLVRRRSDGAELPSWFAASEVSPDS
jgi:hypothetical protein